MSKIDNVSQFHKSLHDNGYLCTEDFSNKVYCALKKKPMSITTLIGQAGTGKSFLPEVLGKVLNCNVYVKQAYQGMDWDEFVRKYEPDENATSGIKARDAEVLVAVKESKKKKVILLLDEWDKTRISSDSYFLDFLQTGRLSVGGKKYEANLDNLIIFFTSNNERDVSEPLLRRGKVIVVEHLPISLVANVLKTKYADNKTAIGMIEPTLKLYHTCVNSDMDKPATIQELCDLINDWVTYKEEGMDVSWEDLVYTNVTKNDRNHLSLQNAVAKETLGEDKESKESFNKELDAEFFNAKAPTSDAETVKVSYMPRMMKMRNFNTAIDVDTDSNKDVYVDVERSEGAYTSAFLEAYDEGIEIDVPHFLGFNQITNDAMQRSKPYRLCELIDEYPKFRRMIKSDGVVVFVDSVISQDDIVNLIQDVSDTQGKAFVRKATKDEIIFRFNFNTGDVNGRWLLNEGCQFITPTKSLVYFASVIANAEWYHNRKWDEGMKVGTYNTYNLSSRIKEGSYRGKDYQSIRRLGSTKDYISIDVGVHGEPFYTNEYTNEHNLLVKSGCAKIKETSRTTTYDMGWAVVRSWHKKNYPNYKSNIVIKSKPTDSSSLAVQLNFIRFKLGLKYTTSKTDVLPMFVTLGADQFHSCDESKWSLHPKRTNVKVNDKGSYVVHAVNTIENTVFLVSPKSDDLDSISSAFDFVDALRSMRNQTLELVC